MVSIQKDTNQMAYKEEDLTEIKEDHTKEIVSVNLGRKKVLILQTVSDCCLMGIKTKDYHCSNTLDSSKHLSSCQSNISDRTESLNSSLQS